MDNLLVSQLTNPVTVFFDFDGVFNWYGSSKSAYRRNPDALGYVRKASVWYEYPGVKTDKPAGWNSFATYQGGTWVDLNWSGELVRKLSNLYADTPYNWVWLTTWSGQTNLLNKTLMVDTVPATEVTWDAYPTGLVGDELYFYRHSRKLEAVRDYMREFPGRPFVWVDDEATTLWDDKYALDAGYSKDDFLVLRPHEAYGITAPMLAELTEFVTKHSK